MSMIAQEKYDRQGMVKYAQKTQLTVYPWLPKYDGTLEGFRRCDITGNEKMAQKNHWYSLNDCC